MKPTLNSGQQQALELYCEYWKHPELRKRPWFEISGPAGSGKTFLVYQIMEELGIKEEYTKFMAFVGKATLALRLAGVPANTIHSTIYNIVTEYEYNEDKSIKLIDNVPKKRQKFQLKSSLEDYIIQLILDEGGMVGGQTARDILSFGIPLMVLGDLRQLPPVMASRMFLHRPDVELTQIMRQEEGSPIIYLSQLATHGIGIPYGSYGNGECRVIRKKQLTDEMLGDADIVISGTNKTRDKINQYIRKYIQGITEPYLVPGDKLICRQNKRNIQLTDQICLVNGLIGYVENVYNETENKGALMEIDFRPEFLQDQYFTRLPINHNYPFRPYEERATVNPMFSGGNVVMEFGNCITCHLSQGSQYDNVIVYVESMGSSLYFRQWLYTAITRAKKKLTIVM